MAVKFPGFLERLCSELGNRSICELEPQADSDFVHRQYDGNATTTGMTS
jgi:hypothetical protein